MRRIRAAIAALTPLVYAAPAAAVLIASGNGTGNTTAPADDPGFAHVGVLHGLTGVYIGQGWVLTANHVGAGPIALNGVLYPDAAGSALRLQHAPGVGADLLLFRIVSDPGLTPIAIAGPPPVNTATLLIGHGRDRGAATTWMGVSGFLWGPGQSMRWGTNKVSERDIELTLGDATTLAFDMAFDSGLPTAHESMATVGDSGGAVFVKEAGTWKLAGILVAISQFQGQPTQSSLYGNLTWAADLSNYADEIASATALPACSDGVDDDGDGLADWPNDPGCMDASDPFETNALVSCDDGFDNDGDGLVDWPDDPGCRDAQSLAENPACDDGIDNDGDGMIDWDGGGGGGVPDPQCTSAWRNKETPGCGIGFELVLLAPLLARLRRLRGAR